MLKLALLTCTIHNNWSIHGLWYDYANHSYPEYCSHIDFQPINKQLNNEMDIYWKSCDNNNYEFWNHELQKHGSCIKKYMLPKLNSTQYFNMTIGIYKSLQANIPSLCNNSKDECEIPVDVVI